MTQKNTIVHIVQHLRPGGIEVLVLEIMRKDPNCRVITLEGNAVDTIANWPAVAEIADRADFLEKPDGWSLSTLIALTRRLRELTPKAVHTHHIGPLLYGGLAARLAGVPARVHTEHDAWHLENNKRATLMKAAVIAGRPVVISDAEMVARRVESILGLPRLVVPNGIDTDRYQPQSKRDAKRAFGLPEEATIIGTAGRLEQVKNQALLIRAFSKVDTRNADSILAIAGDGSLRQELEDLASQLGIDHRVRFLGHVADMPLLYNALDQFVLCSDKEGFPLSLLEAQACGVPVIATDVGGCAEAVCPSIGTLIPAGDENALATALEQIKQEGAISNLRKFIVDNASLSQMLSRYQPFYDQSHYKMA